MAIPIQKLPSLEEAYNGTLFGTAIVAKPDEKKIVMVGPSELIEIEDQPFHPYSAEKLAELAEDIKENGQINPCTVRLADGQKIILAGRNRKKACEIAGVNVACLFIECDDVTANLILVNSNLNQRQELLPSEKAFAYKLQKESYEAKGQRKSTAAVAEQNSENVKMIHRYIKLTDLNMGLLEKVDSGRLPMTVGVELSFLCPDNMFVLDSFLNEKSTQTISIQQAQLLRKCEAQEDFSLCWLLDFFEGQTDSQEEQNQCDKGDQNSPNINMNDSDPPSILELENNRKQQQIPEQKDGLHSTKRLKKIISIKLEDLEQIPCLFNFDAAEPEEIKEFILNSLKQYFSGKSIAQ